MREFEHAGRHGRHAAELPRQRPFGAAVVAQEPAEDFRAGRDAGDLFDLGFAVHGKEADPQREGPRDVLLFLDRIAVADAIRARRPPRAPARSRRSRPCRSRSQAAPRDRGSPDRDWPSRHRRRACRATPSRRHCNCRAPHRDRGRGRAHPRVGCAGIRGYDRSSRHPFEGTGRPALRTRLRG